MSPRRVLWFVFLVLATCTSSGSIGAQSIASGPVFDAASIKPNKGDTVNGGFDTTGGRWQMLNEPISGLILSAYPTASNELVGAPQWVTLDRYDVVAKADKEPTHAEMQSMLRSLLAERFNFVSHYETPERPIYALVLANKDGKLGPQLHRSAFDCAALYAANPTPSRNGRPPMPLTSNNVPACLFSVNGNTVLSGGSKLEMLAGYVSGAAGRVVFDKTGLTGDYEYTLRFSPPWVQASDNAPSLFTALQEQLGLKLEPQRAPVQVLVVDHIDRPSPD